ncbi:MAG: hypothetical protein KME15_09800 [Drouetiella hepatica Uher 2000/2452]|jgi:transposase-like protein|uniref:Transposase n=1 Tax=Drouetiella hepatica Uher 2000/2452 TaxID=904376 RepID=A0A951UNS4_9CYAN|nr:hypothetical protein [Drouetiella hepatica Uher 2000/2452]
MATHRRQYSAEFKAKLVLEVINGEKTPIEMFRSHKLMGEAQARRKLVRVLYYPASRQTRALWQQP